MENEIHKHRLWPTISESDRYVLEEGVESYVVTKLYKRIFGRYEEDVERDNILSSRLYALQFVSPSHLDIAPNIITNEAVLSVVREMQKINSYKPPRDKLSCILTCCQLIQELLHSSGHDTSADSFMPVLNYVVIKAQPANLISNIEYIRRFRMKSKLVSYTDYYFTQLSASVFFIESADASSFTGGRQEFLTSFLRQGLISWKQYEDALNQQEEIVEINHRSISGTSATGIAIDNSDTSLFDEESGAASSMGDLKSLKDDFLPSTRSIDWTGLTDVGRILQDGYPLVTQLSASGDLVARNPLLSNECGNLTVAQVETLLEEYKTMALSYEVLIDGVKQQHTPSVLAFISEFENKLHWRSSWPSEGHLLTKYPFLCSSFQNLTFRDIARLLNSYKILVLETEALVCGIKRRIIPESATNGQIQASLEFPSLEEYQEKHFRFPLEISEAPPLITRSSGLHSKSLLNETEGESSHQVSSLSRQNSISRNRKNSAGSHQQQHLMISEGIPSKQSQDLMDFNDDIVFVASPQRATQELNLYHDSNLLTDNEGPEQQRLHQYVLIDLEELDEDKQTIKVKLSVIDN
eukprot:g3711.t1